MNNSYSDGFFQVITDGCERSAAVNFPLLVVLVRPRHVMDVGCEWGWLRAFPTGGVTDLFGVYRPPRRTTSGPSGSSSTSTTHSANRATTINRIPSTSRRTVFGNTGLSPVSRGAA
jgi:hypothetical protein